MTDSSGISLALLGGYTAGTTTIILFRQARTDGESHDGMMELVNRGRAVRPVTSEKLMLDVESGDWNRYADLPVGAEFVLGGETWVKQHPDYMAELLSRPLYAH